MKIMVVAVLLCARVSVADPASDARIKTLEDKVSKLEARLADVEHENAKYAEAMKFLQQVYEQQKAQTDARDRDEPAADAVWAVDIKDDLKNGQVFGPSNAPVTIVWAFDLQDMFSARMGPIIDDIVTANPGKVRVVLKHFIVHPKAANAHHALCAASKQKHFREYWTALWTTPWADHEQTHSWAGYEPAALVDLAKTTHLDATRFEHDMNSAECVELVRADIVELSKFHVSATPTFYVNGAYSAGAQPKEVFAALVAKKLAESTKSGVPGAQYYDKVVMAKGEKQFRSRGDKK
jgi:protein-disulfide isomerase